MKKIFYFLSGLIVEGESNKISLGRASWWVIFGSAVKILLSGNSITDHHLTVLLLLAGYNFGKKVVDKMKQPAPTDGPG